MRFPARRAVVSGLGLALLAACAKKPEAGASGWDRIKASGVLRVGLEGTYPPFSFVDENGKLAGQIGRLEERIAVLERIATDKAHRLADQIDNLR